MTEREKLKVLVVEDTPEHAELLQFRLEDLKFSCGITHCESGEDAFAHLEAQAQKDPSSAGLPDLIFLDLGLPGENGMEILKKIKTDPRFKNIPVVMLTASDRREDISQSYRLGSVFYMRKPWTEGVMKSLLQQLKISGALKK